MKFYILTNDIPQAFLFALEKGQLFKASIEESTHSGEYGYRLKIDEKGHDVALNEEHNELQERMLEVLAKERMVYEQDNFVLKELVGSPGERFPRIYRPVLSLFGAGSHLRQFVEVSQDENLLMRAINQLVTLIDMLDGVFQVVFPEKENTKVYGSQIKNLLMLACMEVEGQFKGILRENNYPYRTPKKWTMIDYSLLKDVLKLAEYSIGFGLYPELGYYSPFAGWNQDKRLSWYNAYNTVKHNSETDLNQATLHHAINALCAIIILHYAQYGPHVKTMQDELGGYFHFEREPSWELHEKLIPPSKGERWRLAEYPFRKHKPAGNKK